MPQVYNKKHGVCPKDAVYVGRPTDFGNPFTIGKDGNRNSVITKYEYWLSSQPELIDRAKRELRGKDLVCWCAPARCHADVLLKIANKP